MNPKLEEAIRYFSDKPLVRWVSSSEYESKPKHPLPSQIQQKLQQWSPPPPPPHAQQAMPQNNYDVFAPSIPKNYYQPKFWLPPPPPQQQPPQFYQQSQHEFLFQQQAQPVPPRNYYYEFQPQLSQQQQFYESPFSPQQDESIRWGSFPQQYQ